MRKKHHKHLDYNDYKRDYDAIVKEQKKQRRAPLMRVLRLLLIVILLAIIGLGVYYAVSHPDALPEAPQSDAPAPVVEDEPEEQPSGTEEDEQEDAVGQIEAEPEEEPRVPVTLTAGEYVAGIDFPAGRYVLTTEEEECQFAKPGQKWTLRKGDDGYTCTFEDADQLNCAGKITLTPLDEETE